MSHKLMDWILTHDSSLLASLGIIREGGNEFKWWILRVTGTVAQCWYHFSISRFSTLILLSLQIPKNLIDFISFLLKSMMALKSKIWLFKDLCRFCLATCRFYCSTNVITGRFTIGCYKKHSFSTNTKIMLMGTQIHKVLVSFVLSSATVRKVN